MADLTTKYMGLELSNPIVAASSGLTGTIEGVLHCAQAGVGAIVLKSIFEEQIISEVEGLYPVDHQSLAHPEAYDYIKAYGRDHAVDRYLTLIEQSKAKTKLPIIASIHCETAGAWTEFAAKVEDVGADALELNVYLPPTQLVQSAADLERVYHDVVQVVKKTVKIPVSLKVGWHFTALAGFLSTLGQKVDALVIFNRFQRMDIDIDKVALISGSASSKESELQEILRWTSILSGRISADLAATTGIHSGVGVIKALLAGATVAQIATALYRHGFGHVSEMLNEVVDWMEAHGYNSVDEFRGILSRAKTNTPDAYERVQFMKLSVSTDPK
ncbi:MAG: Dihydroorotate dehydrogenase A (fumarate) [Deltaproteobacteria bacterium ADurb.Bin058]|nr:MAG: Dihydroorotate dehydrogenase A (fumarate) [Deltaproteobacteria bacterium ADurb.Bin058]